jgi:hypothetical protein
MHARCKPYLERMQLPTLCETSGEVVRVKGLDDVVDPPLLPEIIEALAAIVANLSAHKKSVL